MAGFEVSAYGRFSDVHRGNTATPTPSLLLTMYDMLHPRLPASDCLIRLLRLLCATFCRRNRYSIQLAGPKLLKERCLASRASTTTTVESTCRRAEPNECIGSSLMWSTDSSLTIRIPAEACCIFASPQSKHADLNPPSRRNLKDRD